MNEMTPEPTPLADAAMAFLRRSLAEVDALQDVGTLIDLWGGDAA